MIQKKICLLGASAVGKTSLVARFVTSMFSQKYQTTVGVKIDKKSLEIDEKPVMLLLWDLYGDDEFQKIRPSYLRGASGYLLVVDGTRRETLTHAISLQRRVAEIIGDVPFVLVLNKIDLLPEWEIEPETLDTKDWLVITTSAKTGQGVEDAFLTLATRLVAS